MQIDDQNFYLNLPSTAGSLKDILHNATAVFQTLPREWKVIITDIHGSTKAVAEGRFNDINTVAASCIIACLNVAKRHALAFPFLYGGDGATVVVPSSVYEEMHDALVALQKNTSSMYGLHLRVGAVSVGEIYDAGKSLQIAKWTVAKGYDQAVFLGDGLAYADKVIKARFETTQESAEETTPQEVDLTGLVCRWKEIKPGPRDEKEVVCVIVQAQDTAVQADVYKEVLDAFDTIYGEFHERHPVKAQQLFSGVIFRNIKRKSLLSRGYVSYGEVFLETGKAIGAALIFRFGKKIPWLDPKKYVQQLIAATNTLHLSGTVHTVMSGTASQREALRETLNTMETDGKIIYGVAACPSSVMTCYVQNLDSEHIHFLDGAGGGYTQASKEFKMKAKKHLENL